MIACDIGGVRFNYRVAGVCIEDGQILLNRVPSVEPWFLPGGRVEVRETSEESLRREMQEELGIAVDIGRLIWVVESLFELDSLSFHEIALYFELKLPAGHAYSDKRAEYRRQIEFGQEAVFRWFPLDVVGELDLVPPFLREGLRDLPNQARHLIERR
jgi:8-oxo-dGTP pyrophosphatase MutT (NUDIX family)